MSKLKANYHTHVELCGHAVGMSEDYVKKAIELGYKSLGMSDHGPMSREMMSEEDFVTNWLDRQMTLETFLNVYLPDLENTKKKYKDKINFYKALEIEFVPGFNDYFNSLKSKLDYLNYAAHFFFNDGIICNSFEGANYNNILGYAQTVEEALSSGLYEIMVHPDVFMNKYESINGNNEWDERCDIVVRRVIEAAIKNDVYLEINCGGLYKVTAANAIPGEYGYPRRQFWEIASEYKELKIVIGVDAHDPEQLGSKEIDEAKEIAKKLGLNVLDFCYKIEKEME